MTSSLRLEVGKTYQNHFGKAVRIERDDQSETYPFRGDNGDWYMENGGFDVHGPSGHDLIREAPSTSNDPVNRPEHYTQGAVECIDAIKASMSAEAFQGYLKGNIMKYLWRYKLKGGVESMQKAKWYTDRLIAEIG